MKRIDAKLAKAGPSPPRPENNFPSVETNSRSGTVRHHALGKVAAKFPAPVPTAGGDYTNNIKHP
jgi:hypothetical protein